MKRFLLPASAFLVALLILAAGLELVATAYLIATEGRYIPARTRFASKTNTFVGDLGRESGCSYLETLFPHPYLGFVHHANPPCGIPGINNVGLFGADFPSVHRDDRFVVLLTGGSVASQFAQSIQNGPSYLERFLNAQLVSPTGKPFLVLNGADGAWKQPQQAILFLLYADAVDAVVTLDGFNEHYMIGAGERFEYPASNFASVNPLATRSFGAVVAQYYLGRLREAAASNPIFSRSEAAYAIVTAVEDFVAKRANNRPSPKTTVESLFALPAGWPEAQRKEWALNQYKKYIRVMQAVAQIHNVRTAYFIQPAPAIAKTLTEAEQRVVGDLSYKPVYEEMTAALMTLTHDRIAVMSTADVFAQESGTLYADPIHLVRAADGSSRGYELLARRMTADLARTWSLRPRGSSAAAALSSGDVGVDHAQKE